MRVTSAIGGSGRGLVWGAGLSAGLLLLAGCSLIFDPELKEFSEFGARCNESSECASGICRYGRCSRECTGSDPCSDTSQCQSGYCQFTSPPPLDGPPRISFLYIGEIQEHGMIKAHDDARQYVVDEIDGASAEGLENVAASKASQTIDTEVAEGSNIVIGTSSDFRDAIQNGALRHQNVNFLMYGAYSGFEPGPNLGSYMGRMYQVMYMMGALAGQMTQTLRVGIVAPVANPETVRNINAFTQGFYAEVEDPNGPSIEPNPAVVVRWINTWTNEELERTATEELVEQGYTDIILGYTESTTPLVVAAQMETELNPDSEMVPVYVIGYGNPDVCSAARSRCLSAAYWNVGPMLARTVQQMVEGSWVPSVVWEQIKRDVDDSSVYFADISTSLVPGGVRVHVANDLLDNLVEDSTAGRMLPFGGPVRDTTGGTRIAPRSYPSDEDLLLMCWLVEGTYELTHDDPPELAPAEVPASCRGDR